VTIFNPLTGSQLSIISALVTYAWLLVIPTALSYVGGVDGLSEGTSAIAILILTLIGIRNGDPLTITLGVLCFGGLLGFLPYNFYPKAIMSEHLIYGYVIAILAILTRGKITTSLLILTVPLVDFIYVTGRRAQKYFNENKGHPFSLRMLLHRIGTGDKTHLHHRMLELGWGHARISITQYMIYAALGLLSLIVTGLYLTLVILGSVAIIVLIFYYINRKIHHGKRELQRGS
jgi:UDP-GlcNAc:undecaprenyl-phosphate GlcNAc-1-phosphate transferase